MTLTRNSSCFGVSDGVFTSVREPLQDTKGVLHILAERNHFEILKPVVGFVPVLMVNSHLFGDPDESLSHKPVNVPSRFFAADAKNDLFVTVGRIDIAMKKSGFLALHSDNPTDTPEAAHFVQRKVFNWSPFFHTCHFTVHDILAQGESS